LKFIKFSLLSLSGISSNSLYSVDSINSDNEDIHASSQSLAHPSPRLGALSPSSSYEVPATSYEPSSSGLRHRKMTSEWSKDNRAEFLLWWDEEVGGG